MASTPQDFDIPKQYIDKHGRISTFNFQLVPISIGLVKHPYPRL